MGSRELNSPLLHVADNVPYMEASFTFGLSMKQNILAGANVWLFRPVPHWTAISSSTTLDGYFVQYHTGRLFRPVPHWTAISSSTTLDGYFVQYHTGQLFRPVPHWTAISSSTTLDGYFSQYHTGWLFRPVPHWTAISFNINQTG